MKIASKRDYLKFLKLEPLFGLLLLFSNLSFGQNTFVGTFSMNFQTNYSDTTNLCKLNWTIDKIGNNNRQVMEMDDDMKRRGVNKRVLFDFIDSSWTMVMAIKNIKQGTKIKATKMYKDSCDSKKINLKQIKGQEIISGLKCRKLLITNSDYESEVWITDQYNYDASKLYELMLHCGLMNPILKKGKWYEYHLRKKGMIIKVKTKNKIIDEYYIMQLDQIKQGKINYSDFDISGYKISVIEEGKNCGAVEVQ